jgi:hypothetical protein
MILSAAVDPDRFPLPPQPEDGGDEEQRRHERALKRREDEMKIAADAAQQFNQRVAPWMYFIDEATLSALRPGEQSIVQNP